MARMVLFAQLVAAVLVVVSTASAVQAAASNSRRSTSFDHHGAELELNERGELVGEPLYNERGEMAENPRIRLVKRRAGADNSTHVAKRQSSNFNYGSTKVRGVNIGGWLVTEPWITPSLYDNSGDGRIVDEFTFGKYSSKAGSKLERHFSTFYTQSDFNQIAAAGLNHVRIPIGYWALDKGTSPFYKGSQYAKLKQAVGWARNAGLKVVVDLHGAPGSQNGFDNSGKKGSPNWFTKDSYKSRALEVIRRFASDFQGDADTVTAIELLNEPLTSDNNQYLSFYEDYYNNGYYTVRYPSGSTQNSNVDVMVHDGFQQLSYWNGKLQPSTYEGVLLDTHQYSVFNLDQIRFSDSQRLNYYCSLKGSIAQANTQLYTITGEWTTAPTDCAKYLNGRGIGARYDGSFAGSSRVGSCSGKSGSGASFSSSYKSTLGKLFDTQRSVYEKSGSGWIFWTWKTENAADWDYSKGLKYGWITRNLNSFSKASC